MVTYTPIIMKILITERVFNCFEKVKSSKIPLWGVGLGDLGSGEGGDFSPQGVIPS
jgi:hypothetical protein